MPQWLREQTDVLEDPGSSLSTHIVIQNCNSSSLGILWVSETYVMHRQASKYNIHTHKIIFILKKKEVTWLGGKGNWIWEEWGEGSEYDKNKL